MWWYPIHGPDMVAAEFAEAGDTEVEDASDEEQATMPSSDSPIICLPSGKHTKNYGKSKFLIGKINIWFPHPPIFME